MNSIYFLSVIIAIICRVDASFPAAFHFHAPRKTRTGTNSTRRVRDDVPISSAGFPSYVPYVKSYVPYVRGVAAPAHFVRAPVMRAAPSFYPIPVAYPQRQRELRNFAGALQRESQLLTDVTIRLPAKKAL